MRKKLPKYQKIIDYVVEGITSRSFTHAIPSENQLAKKFGVSRMTARKALDVVQRDGLVDRVPGKGTFVKKQHYTTGFFRIRPFQKWAEDLNVKLTSRLLEGPVLLDPPAGVSTLLSCKEAVIFFRRLWYFDGRAVRYEIRYLRPDLCAGVLTENIAETSIHEYIINTCGIPLTAIKQSVVAVGLAEKNARLFKEPAGYPAFHFQRTSYSYELPVSYVEYFMRGEMSFRDTFSPKLDPADFGHRGKSS